MDFDSLFTPRESSVIPGLYYKTFTVGQAKQYHKLMHQRNEIFNDVDIEDMSDDELKDLNDRLEVSENELCLWMCHNIFCDANGNLATQYEHRDDVPVDITEKMLDLAFDVFKRDDIKDEDADKKK